MPHTADDGVARAPAGNAAGPERELLKLLAYEVPEVRGLTARLVGKLAGKVTLRPGVLKAVRALTDDENGRVQASVRLALTDIERGLAAAGEKLIPPHGGYEDLESYQMSLIAFDGTVYFCNRYINIRSRTHDQMWQAARSGKQNIVEGSVISGTSKKSELKLLGVARGSLKELIEDYQDYLRTHKLSTWDKNEPRTLDIRRLAYVENKSYETYKPYVEGESVEVSANTLLCVTHQAKFLLDRQIEALEAAFEKEGGFTERLYRVRTERRKKQYGGK